jgi:hypothetical protein
MCATAKISLKAEGEIILSNILEDELETLGKGGAELSFAPFEIKTVKIK